MNRLEIMKKARLKRKPILLFDSKEYSIHKIPLNYKTYIKLPKKPKFRTMDRDCYSRPEYGIEYAHQMAKDYIKKCFISRLQ